MHKRTGVPSGVQDWRAWRGRSPTRGRGTARRCQRPPPAPEWSSRPGAGRPSRRQVLRTGRSARCGKALALSSLYIHQIDTRFARMSWRTWRSRPADNHGRFPDYPRFTATPAGYGASGSPSGTVDRNKCENAGSAWQGWFAAWRLLEHTVGKQGRYQADCAFRRKPATDSEESRPPCTSDFTEPYKEIGLRFGIGQSGVTQASQRIAPKSSIDKRLRKIIKRTE